MKRSILGLVAWGLLTAPAFSTNLDALTPDSGLSGISAFSGQSLDLSDSVVTGPAGESCVFTTDGRYLFVKTHRPGKGLHLNKFDTATGKIAEDLSLDVSGPLKAALAPFGKIEDLEAMTAVLLESYGPLELRHVGQAVVLAVQPQPYHLPLLYRNLRGEEHRPHDVNINGDIWRAQRVLACPYVHGGFVPGAGGPLESLHELHTGCLLHDGGLRTPRAEGDVPSRSDHQYSQDDDGEPAFHG